MNTTLLSLLAFTLLQLCSAGVISEEGQRDDKLLPFLAVVSFPHIECSATTGGMKGVCYNRKQCRNLGGTELSGSCAQGYGVCCAISVSCPTTPGGTVMIKQNLTTISSADTPRSCSFVIPKQPDVCQIRLDFQQFQLGDYKYGTPPMEMPPNPLGTNDGSCVNDKLLIPPTQNLPDGLPICGTAANQHLYLHYGDQDKITLSLTQMTMGNYAIKVTMIKCNSVLKAPMGCTQYFREKSARVESFNFPNMQLNNQRYSVCVHNSDGERQIQWRPCSPPPTVPLMTMFFVSGIAPPVPPQMSGAENCGTDYVIIPGSRSDRYCGGNFTNVEASSMIPFTMWVNFDGAETPKELIPSPITDKMTGCPLGFMCSLAPEKCGLTTDPNGGGTCFPPPGYAALIDRYNIGFCLQYDLGSV